MPYLTPEKKALICMMRKGGISLRKIASIVGTHWTTVSKVCKRYENVENYSTKKKIQILNYTMKEMQEK
jgi:IS30 family transposase